jgi:hypothetical protein
MVSSTGKQEKPQIKRTGDRRGRELRLVYPAGGSLSLAPNILHAGFAFRNIQTDGSLNNS